MLEYGAQWTLVGPDGTTLDFNPSPSNGIYLEEISGFDMPSVRSNVEALPEADGAVAGNAYFGARSVTFSGLIANVNAAERNQLVVNLQRVARALRGDVLLKSTASGLPAMQAAARLEQPLRITGQGMAKRFLLSLVCPDPRLYSQAEHTGTASGAVQAGAAFPWAFPVDFGDDTGSTIAVSVTNAGNFATPPVLVVTGPAGADFEIEGGNDQSIYVDDIALSAGESVTINVAARTAVKSDGTNVYAYVRFPGSTWWLLEPGSTSVRLWANGTSGATSLDVIHRDAWA